MLPVTFRLAGSAPTSARTPDSRSQVRRLPAPLLHRLGAGFNIADHGAPSAPGPTDGARRTPSSVAIATICDTVTNPGPLIPVIRIENVPVVRDAGASSRRSLRVSRPGVPADRVNDRRTVPAEAMNSRDCGTFVDVGLAAEFGLHRLHRQTVRFTAAVAAALADAFVDHLGWATRSSAHPAVRACVCGVCRPRTADRVDQHRHTGKPWPVRPGVEHLLARGVPRTLIRRNIRWSVLIARRLPPHARNLFDTSSDRRGQASGATDRLRPAGHRGRCCQRSL